MDTCRVHCVGIKTGSICLVSRVDEPSSSSLSSSLLLLWLLLSSLLGVVVLVFWCWGVCFRLPAELVCEASCPHHVVPGELSRHLFLRPSLFRFFRFVSVHPPYQIVCSRVWPVVHRSCFIVFTTCCVLDLSSLEFPPRAFRFSTSHISKQR